MGVAVQIIADILQDRLRVEDIVLGVRAPTLHDGQEFVEPRDGQTDLTHGIPQVFDPHQPLIVTECRRVRCFHVQGREGLGHGAADRTGEILVSMPAVPGSEIGGVALLGRLIGRLP
ncbi:hypothetical protein THSYN_17645 [Candidatus Thiodictyon syntrophicum]|jgi:hypothetical protein|uniref:Uncharacterized protein n=1 Tax=Candidatus Thiodictyon syntrophicum TaxID=1166950 RepID=A0A2K8UAH6_9GAMM|nr:hypothetical protein THSYN_17645 [Candidatus Thiodictyon syntrophicum]